VPKNKLTIGQLIQEVVDETDNFVTVKDDGMKVPIAWQLDNGDPYRELVATEMACGPKKNQVSIFFDLKKPKQKRITVGKLIQRLLTGGFVLDAPEGLVGRFTKTLVDCKIRYFFDEEHVELVDASSFDDPGQELLFGDCSESEDEENVVQVSLIPRACDRCGK
jgi:hypothetical protein